jgi:D-3-phosphoglycerate dehydrogenase
MRSRFRILVADALGEEGLTILREAGEVEVKTGMDEAALREALRGFDALVVRSATKVTARALEGADRLAVIGRAGIGVDNIDVDAATTRGIVVMNTPDAGATTTAEHAISLLLSMCRNVPAADAALKAGRWDKKKFTGVELTGKTLGVVGLGNIGRIVAERGKGLGMEVIAHDPFVPQDRAPANVRMVDLDELCAQSDFVTIHVPLMEATRHLFDRERFAKMKPGARLVHAARGGIVDEAALCEALDSGRLAGAALDVFETEPLPEDHPLRHRSDVVLTPHIAASTVEASRNVALDMARQIVTCLWHGIALNGVNVPRVSPGEAAAIGPFLDLAHNLAKFVVRVHAGRLQSVRLTVQGGLPAGAAHPLTVACLTGALQDASEGPVTQVNAERIAKDLGVRVHTETTTMKRDFMNLLRVEVVVDEQRHFVTGTVLGHRHGRLVEYDDYVLDAIPEPPLMVTWHSDEPGVLGQIGTALGDLGINIERMQLGEATTEGSLALGIWNLERPLEQAAREKVASLPPVRAVHVVD